jgi:hypothetical protein
LAVDDASEREYLKEALVETVAKLAVPTIVLREDLQESERVAFSKRMS